MDEDSLEELRKRVWENQQWPQKYIFKFIVPNVGGKVKQVVAMLPSDAKFSYRHTENLRHVSVTATCVMDSVEKIQEINQNVSVIQGVISL